MTVLVANHRNTTEIALFKSEEEDYYWIGAYSNQMYHQNGEPNYYWIAGDFQSEQEGIDYLSQMSGNEF